MPRFLIAANLPLQGDYRSLGEEMDAAIRYVLGKRGFRAGRQRVGYQVCDESTGGEITADGCARTARAYAHARGVVGVIGPFSSDCAIAQIPIANRSGLAMLSPTATHVGLTHGGPGAANGEPDTLYPTGRRTFARVVADDSVQAAANGLLARRLGIRRLFLLESAGFSQAGTIADGVRFAAERSGVRVVGEAQWDPSAHTFTDLARRVRRSRPDGVFLSGGLGDGEGRLIRALHRARPHAQLLAPDGFAATDALVDAAGEAAEGMTVTVTGVAPGALGRRGRAFVAELTQHLGVTPAAYSVYAAQAAEVMLDAIGRSDGTRPAVTDELFRTRVRDGIVGTFILTAEGDSTERGVTVYRMAGGRREVLTVLRPGSELVPG